MMGKTTYGLFGLILLIASCGTKDIGKTEIPQEPKPRWVQERPFAPGEYIGIGIASKTRHPLDYQQVAKKNALNDLATEISVEVQGETFLNSLEVNRDFRETYMSQINTTTTEKIEGFDVAGIWEDGGEYWIYYRLNRAKHASVKAQKKKQALDSAKDFYLKGKEALELGSISQGVDLHLNALLEMKEYWVESNPYMLDGSQVFLDNEIYSSLRSAVADIRIEPNFNTIVLNQDNGYVGRVLITVTRNDKPLRNTPIVYEYDQGKYKKPKTMLTNAEGEVVIEVRDANSENLSNKLHVWLDVRELIGEVERDPLLDPIVRKLDVEEVNVPIEYDMPVIFLQSSEREFGQVTGASNLTNAVRNSLTQRGMQFTANPGDADLLMTLESDTREGGTSQGFHVTFLELQLTVVESSSGQTIYGQTLSDIKGLQLNFEAASTEAYKKARKKIEKEISRDMLSQIL